MKRSTEYRQISAEYCEMTTECCEMTAEHKWLVAFGDYLEERVFEEYLFKTLFGGRSLYLFVGGFGLRDSRVLREDF